MSVNLSELKPGVVVVESDGSICVITELRQGSPVYPVLYVRKQVTGTVYKGRPESFKAVIGQVDLGALKGLLEGVKEERHQGFDEPLFDCPENLKGLKVGDAIKVKHGYVVVEAVYGGYSHNRPKYPISYTVNGKRFKGVVAAVVGKAA